MTYNRITTLNQAIGVGLILVAGHLADRGAPVALARRLSLVLATAAVLLLARALRRGLPPCQHEF